MTQSTGARASDARTSRGVLWLVSMPGICFVILPALILCFWKSRVVWGAPHKPIAVGVLDLYLSYFPRTAHVFERLAEGSLPLWNPFQLTGQPLSALPATGLFYPPNWIYLGVSVPVGIELHLLLHAWIGAVGMVRLGSELGFGRLACLGGSVTFLASGFATTMIDQPVLFAGLAWLPVILWQTTRVVDGRPGAAAGLALALALGWLTGATEVLFHGFFAAGTLALFRLAGTGEARWRPIATGVAAFVLGVGLAAVQLVPSFELVGLSARAPGSLSPEQALRTIPYLWVSFQRSMVGLGGPGWIGLLPLVLIGFAFLRHPARPVIVGLALLGSAAALLMVDGPVSRAYTEIPIIGSLFRRTIKFADLYVLCGACVAMAGIDGIAKTRFLPRSERLRSAPWLVALAVGAALVVLRVSFDASALPAVLLLGLLAAWGLAPSGRFVTSLVLCMVGLQTLHMGLAWRMTTSRPIERPGWLTPGTAVFEQLGEEAKHERTYVTANLAFTAAFAAKRGMIHRTPILSDYEPLTPARQAEYFSFASRGEHHTPFNGVISLGSNAHWPLIHLTGSQNLIVQPHQAHALLAGGKSDYLRVRPGLGRKDAVLLRHAAAPMPRAYLATQTRVIADPGEILETLASPAFDPRNEVILESALPGWVPSSAPTAASGVVALRSHEPERVVLEVDTDRPGVVVLTDLHYPGWQVSVDGEPRDLLRANYLFRGVAVAPGQHTIEFVFAPASLRIGAGVTVLSVVILLGVCTRGRAGRAPARHTR